ncbi:ATP-dependent RNA helicase vasa isoform X2 [Cylas formicarius]|uniref:ATP-dependent RNA helicase vasa isoform X2 n=1 Tax=Cylas formicarius TaxID=197179 RepID=UPI0029588DC6|nr:ATP-dependent RNA helicase vasa isoform X2 [Cylas formicarius]
MDEDWDDEPTSIRASSSVMTGVTSDGGTMFGAGRGFKTLESCTNDRDWGSVGDNFGDSNGSGGRWGSDNRMGSRGSRGTRGGRGGRGGGHGGQRNNNGFSNDFHDGGSGAGGWGHSGDDVAGFANDRGRGRGRGGGRGGRGGRGRGGFGGDEDRGGWGEQKSQYDEGDDGGEPPKPREIYVPVERVGDDDLFTATISSGVNFIKLDEIEVKVSGENVPRPIRSFEESGLRSHLLENIKKSGYGKPTPIQKYAIPIILAGRDVMGCAQTGSGKTAAFLLPMINKILASQDPPVRDGDTAQPKVVIVSPTRELAIQIHEQAKKFAHNSIVKTVVAYGGTSVTHQKNQVLNGCHILVATPGRLNDFVNRGHISFASLEFFVLDEADRMLDMGFLPTVEQMLGHASMTATGERQTLMFSATFPEEIQHLAGKFLHNYAFIVVGIVGSASTDVEQVFHQVSRFDKRNKLIEMLKHAKGERTLVFVETKRNADFLATLLSENDIQSTSIHGDRLQREREQALWDFKKGIRSILLATGVAARGLDIEGVQHVINYDLPKSIDEYVHRIGRTGRVGNRGKATSFYDSSSDGALAGSLANILKQAGQEVPDFLSSGGYGYGDSNDNFGGRDIRGDDFGRAQNMATQPAEVVEEDW